LIPTRINVAPLPSLISPFQKSVNSRSFTFVSGLSQRTDIDRSYHAAYFAVCAAILSQGGALPAAAARDFEGLNTPNETNTFKRMLAHGSLLFLGGWSVAITAAYALGGRSFLFGGRATHPLRLWHCGFRGA
jgi:hypothetical protein